MPKISDPARESKIAVRVEGVSKTFVLQHTHTLKEAAMALLRRRQLTSRFNAVDDLSLEVGIGESVALLGVNGSGKSTLLKLLSGVYRPDAGRIGVRGRVAGLLEVGAGLHPDLSGRENVYLNAAILGMTKEETDARFDEIVEFSGVGDFIDTEVKHYSSGMFMRLAFAVAVHTEFDVLLVDEVLAVGDEAFQKKCLARIADIQAQGKTLIIVSHNLEQMEEVADRGLLMKKGRLVFDGPVSSAVAQMRAG